MAAPAIHSSNAAGNNGHPGGLSSWTSLGSMNSTAGTSSPRSTWSNSLTNSNAGQLSSFGSGSGSSMHSRSTTTTAQAPAGVPQPTQEELGGRTYLEWIRAWTDDHVAQWLADNRCAAHALTFANNDIRGDVILDVDQQALKEMGVQSVGDRIKITVAVKKLRQACTAANLTQQLAGRRPLHHSSSIGSLQSSGRETLASNPSSPVYASHPGQAVVAQAQLARRVSGGKGAHRVPPPLHLTSSSTADPRLPQAYQTNTSFSNAATYGARTSSNAANAVLLAATSNFSNRAATSPRSGSYPVTPSNKSPAPATQPAPAQKGPSGSRSQQHLAAPTISTTAASPTASPSSSLTQWSHRKAGSLGGSVGSPSSGSSHPFAAATQGHGRPSTAAASYQQAVSPSSPSTETLAASTTLHAPPYRAGNHAHKASFGNSGLSPIVEANSGGASPISLDHHSSSRPLQHNSQGFTVGKGGFGRPTTSGGVVSIGATSGSGQVMPLEDVLRKTVKFISDDNVSKMVSLEGAKDVHEVLVRVLKKFNKIPGNIFPPPPNTHQSRTESGSSLAELNGHGIFTTNGDGVARALSESELWNICQSAGRPERSRGLLLRRIHVTPTSPEEARAVKTRKLKNFFGEELTRSGLSPTSPTQMLDMSIPSTEVEPSSPAPSSPTSSSDRDEVLSAVAPTPPQKPRQQRNSMNRASTVSIMSGLNWGFGGGSGSVAASQAQTRSPSTGFLQSNHQKLRSFFGQRPPSELINTHLVEYFPTAASDKKILSKQVRNNVRKSMLRRNSSFNPALSGIGKTSWDASGDNQSMQGLGASRFSMSTDAGSNYRDSVDAMPPLPSKDGNVLASRFSEDYEASPTRPAMLGHLSSSSAAPSISIDSDDEESNDTRSVSSAMTRRTTRRERPSSRLSVWSHTKSNKDSDTASVLTVEEITEDLEKRRLSRASWAGDNASELAGLGDESGDGTGSEGLSTSRYDISDETVDGGSLRSEIIEEEDEGAEEDEDEVDLGEEEEEEEEQEDDDEEDEEDGDLDVPQTVTAKAKRSTFRWVRGALIGAGSFGQVYLGMNAANGLLMAVKQVELPTGNSHNEERKKNMLSALEREIELLKEMQHENVVQYLDSSSDGTNLYIFLEYVPGGSVTHMLSNYGSFEEPLVRTFVKQILRGLAYLHENDIIHRDIKGANILVDNRGGIKISDFGISKKVEDNLLSATSRIHRPSLQGSVFWMAPEVVKQTSYTAKADIWSLGCLVVEMFTGQHPWMELTQMQAIFKIGSSKDARPKIPSNASAVGQDFLDLTFHMDYNARPTAAELLKHAFVTEDMEE